MGESANLRVLFITRKWRPAIGGLETYCHELTAELADRVDLTVRALPGKPDGGRPSAAANIAFGLRILWYLACHAGRFDVIHLADMAIWPLALVGGLRNRRAILVASAHGTDVAYPGRVGLLPSIYAVYLRLGSRLLPGLRVIANSRATAGLCRSEGFADVAVVQLAVRKVAAGRVADADPFVLFVGRLVPRKGCGWFVGDVLPRLDEHIRLKVVGTVWDKSEKSMLDTPRIDFLGPLFGEKLRDLRRQAIAVIMPNIPLGKGDFVEGFGLAALEAAADGGIICAARLDGIIDAVRDGETGFLLPAGDGAAWADKIADLSGWSTAERNVFSERARTIVAADYSWDRVAAETLGVYRRDGVAAKEREQ